ncbi:MAG: transglycosylase domain-containing protein, partial [Thermoanaerobaculia bacterium]|nr:transglycosylase domain-containing protein [Thermoanaerobaculia bacterium]
MRELLHRRLTAFLAATVMLMIWMAVAYHYWQVHRVGRFLFDEQWKTPTVIRSASNPDHPAIELYGPGWSQREPIRIDSLPPHVPDAFVAAEDVRFRRHIGIDPLGIARAIWVNLREGGIRQGGSTITQQLVKSLILSNERTWRRKLIEIPVALKVERELTKDEILEAYLNSVYLGHVDGNPVHGIDEAAPVYLGRAPDELTPAEAALLAAIVPAPNRDNPLERPEVAKRRRDAVLQTMLRRGMIEKSEHETALSSPARFVSTPRQVDEPLSWYLTALRGELIELVGADVVEAGGLTIEASVDPSMQRSAELAIERGVARLRSSYSWIREQAAVEPLQAVIVSVDPRSGAIRSMVGSSTRASSFDRVRNMKRQPGS